MDHLRVSLLIFGMVFLGWLSTILRSQALPGLLGVGALFAVWLLVIRVLALRKNPPDDLLAFHGKLLWECEQLSQALEWIQARGLVSLEFQEISPRPLSQEILECLQKGWDPEDIERNLNLRLESEERRVARVREERSSLSDLGAESGVVLGLGAWLVHTWVEVPKPQEISGMFWTLIPSLLMGLLMDFGTRRAFQAELLLAKERAQGEFERFRHTMRAVLLGKSPEVLR
jgi:hypothetical protein